MHRKVSPLLAELHSHTTWSDGDLSVRELVELYGSAGFDVLCVSDHAYREDDPVITPMARGVGAEAYAEYLAEIESEAILALRRYGLLVIPGLELSYNDTDPSVRPMPSPSACASARRSRTASRRRFKVPTRPGRRSSAHTRMTPSRRRPGRTRLSASPPTRTGSAASSTGTSSSTARSSSRGSRRRAGRASRAATFTARSTSAAGRRRSPARVARRRSSTTSARHARSTSPASTSRPVARLPETDAR